MLSRRDQRDNPARQRSSEKHSRHCQYLAQRGHYQTSENCDHLQLHDYLHALGLGLDEEG